MLAAQENKIRSLIERSNFTKELRSFFYQHGYIEVDTPLLSHRSSIDSNIDLIEVSSFQERCFLVSSPEYAIKRLLAQGLPNAFQLSHVFRAGEISKKHNPEFMMLEWYRHNDPLLSDEANFESFIKETVDVVELGVGPKKQIFCTYWDLFEKTIRLNLKAARQQSETACKEAVQQWLTQHDPQHPIQDDDPLDTWLSYLMSYHVEAKFAPDTLHIITHFPASQAGLATTYQHDHLDISRRFEVYYGSLELANGYHELNRSQEQLLRLQIEQAERLRLGKDPLLIDERFVASLDSMPSCCGVALGFDRLLICKLGASHIDQVLPFSWQDS